MAATFCNSNYGSGIQVHNEHILNRNRIARIYPTFPDSRPVILSCSLNCPKKYQKNFIKQVEVKQASKHRRIFVQSSSAAAYEEKNEDDISTATLIWRAVKLPIYSVALVPLTVGAAAAYLQTGCFSTRLYFTLLASSVLIVTWLNLSNDVYDSDTGADKNKKESVVNIVGSRTGTFIAACVSLVLGLSGLIFASVEAGNLQSILLLFAAVICGYIYQCPPFRLSYHGLGEPLCFAAFGPFATTAFYLLHSKTKDVPITGTVLSASLLVGLTTSLILFCSHFHQIDGDKAVGKISPLVRLGTRTGSEVVKMAVMLLYSILFALGLSRTLPFTCIILCAITIPIGKLVVSYVEANHQDKSKIFMAKYYCVRLHAVFGAALAAGIVAARTLV